MKIKRIAVETDEGVRAISITNPIEVDPTCADAPENFRLLALALWSCVHGTATGNLPVERGEPS